MGHQRRRGFAHIRRHAPPGARRPLGIVGLVLAILLLGCGCTSTVVFGVVRSATHHR